MGAKGAPKTGGRKKGSVNRATIERQLVRQLDEVRGNKTETAKAALARYMAMAEGVAARFRQQIDDPATATDKNLKLLGEWVDRAIKCASELANYQSPRYRAVAVMMTPTDQPAQTTAPVIDNEPRDAEERERHASESYLRLVKG